MPALIKVLQKRNVKTHSARKIKKPNPLTKAIHQNKRVPPNAKIVNKKPTGNFEIFAYCSKNYKDAFDFVIPSWTKWDTVSKVTIYTDWPCPCNDPKVEIVEMFEPDENWVIGTGRRLDVIQRYSKERGICGANILFLDIDCLITGDVSHVFREKFDIAITRLNNFESHTNQTATAGLWFARLNKGYFNFIGEWFKTAKEFKTKRIGIKKHLISYVQYSFTKVARTANKKYHVLPIDENVYNSEHTVSSKWIAKIRKANPCILHYKGRRFRDKKLVNQTLKAAGVAND